MAVARPRASAGFNALRQARSSILEPIVVRRFISSNALIERRSNGAPRCFTASQRAFTQSARCAKPNPPPAPYIELSPNAGKTAAPKKRRGGYIRWTWRLTKLAFVGGVAYLAWVIWDGRHPAEQFDPHPSKKTLVVLGTGWGSVALLKKLDTENYNVIVISPRNYFLFTPLLPSCTTGTIEHRSIMEPIRNFLRHKKATVKYYEAQATKIDYEKRIVYIDDESPIKGDVSSTEVPFDLLVVGVGAENATFGKISSLQYSNLLNYSTKAFPASVKTLAS